jgi:hypothetical protein
MQKIFQEIKNIATMSQYIYLLLLFMINNRQHFKINSDIYDINTSYTLDLYYPHSHLSVYQKSAHYTRI